MPTKHIKLDRIDNPNIGRLNSCRSKIGLSVTRPLQTKRPPDTSDKAITLKGIKDQPKCAVIAIPANSDESVDTHSVAPYQSNFELEIWLVRWESSAKKANSAPAAETKDVTINTLLQPAYVVTKPPTVGPATLPKPTNIRTSPTAFPLCLSPKAEIAMINAVPCTIAPPIPCRTLPDSNISIEGENALAIPPKRNTISPETMTFLLPNMSVSLPIGNNKAATISKYVVFIH